ncbi:hypothetical protein Q4F19_08010 [Sphingomonas sp. BIUV-7]|uniref:DUF1206 domain-containing protein n=1 Tax=Sphingomonas natans TaxID=3063330 RepID=A0ABT8Y7M5_9SPHN|nr:hypothetical protein [Sphingomonas sp. BIUV-7]MDO6414324.1 hypothetical protein [Sphingomonas sp. BIUV-7]
MTDTDPNGRPLPLATTSPAIDAPVPPVVASEAVLIKPASTREVFGRGLLLILGEMVQLVLAFALALYALACCAALLVKLNDAVHFMGEKFVTPRVITDTLGGFLAHSVAYLVIGILAAIFAIKLLDLVVRVLQRRARLAERG